MCFEARSVIVTFIHVQSSEMSEPLGCQKNPNFVTFDDFCVDERRRRQRWRQPRHSPGNPWQWCMTLLPV